MGIVSQSSHQKVFNRGGLHSKIWQTQVIYSVSYFGGLELCLGGLSPPNPLQRWDCCDHACVASESCRIFPRDQSCALKNTKGWKCRKIWITRCEKSRFYPVLAKIRIKNPNKPNVFINNNVRNHSYHKFWQRSWLTEVYCTSTIQCNMQSWT